MVEHSWTGDPTVLRNVRKCSPTDAAQHARTLNSSGIRFGFMTQRRMVAGYRRFGTSFCPIFKGHVVQEDLILANKL